MRRKIWFVTVALVLIMVSGGYAAAANYPSKDISMVIGFSPGGGSDAMTSMVRPYLEKIFKVSMIPVYKPGSGGDIGMMEVAKSKPDGHTVVASCTPMVPMNPVVRKTQYAMSDFIYVANVVTDPGIFVVPANSPYKTMADIIKDAQAKPGKISVGVSAVPGDDWFSMMMFQDFAKLQFNIVPFTGDGPSWQAAMAGHIEASSNNLSLVLPQIKGGKLRALAIMTQKRSPFLPDLPTFKELGYNVDNGSARGFSMVKGTPKEIVDTFADAIKKTLENEEFKAKALATAFPVDYMGPEDYASYMKMIQETHTPLWKKHGQTGMGLQIRK